MSLLETVQGLLERTYRMQSGIEQIGRFVIGDRGYARLYGRSGEVRSVRAADGQQARTLVRYADDEVRACIYYPDEQIRRLEAFPPQRGLGDENVDAFATLVEEIDHLLLVAERSREARPLTLFELELHANVSKHLVLTRFLARNSKRLRQHHRLWLRHHLFGKLRFSDPDPSARARYRQAARWAVKLIDGLAALDAGGRIDTLRSFHSADTQGKVRLISRV